MPVPIRSPKTKRHSPAVDAPTNWVEVELAIIARQIAELVAQNVALKAMVLDNDEARTQYAELLVRARATIAESEAAHDAQTIGMAAQSLPGDSR